MLGDLFRPFAFLTIAHPSRLPFWVNWVLPIGATAAIVATLAWFNVQINVFGDQGLIAKLLAFVQTLVGFFIASLAAVASFNSRHLDRTMPHPAPTMIVKYNGALETVKLTRRRFLCAMFAYLTALSFIFSMVAIAALTIAPPLAATISPIVAWILKQTGMFIFLVACFQMTSVTFWGLFYLGERMLTPD